MGDRTDHPNEPEPPSAPSPPPPPSAPQPAPGSSPVSGPPPPPPPGSTPIPGPPPPHAAAAPRPPKGGGLAVWHLVLIGLLALGGGLGTAQLLSSDDAAPATERDTQPDDPLAVATEADALTNEQAAEGDAPAFCGPWNDFHDAFNTVGEGLGEDATFQALYRELVDGYGHLLEAMRTEAPTEIRGDVEAWTGAVYDAPDLGDAALFARFEEVQAEQARVTDWTFEHCTEVDR